MTERDKILGRVREALRVTAPRPGAGPDPPGPSSSTGGRGREWLPAVSPSAEEWRACFARNAALLKADFHWLETAAAAHGLLLDRARRERWGRIATHGSGMAAAAAASLGLPVLTTDGGYEVGELERCDAGISECDVLVAQTGSVLLTSRSAGGRALSILPPHHVVVARRDQLVPDLPAAFEFLHHRYAGAWPSLISFVTGPSRTGDIERILVLGAHGPRQLTILVVP